MAVLSHSVQHQTARFQFVDSLDSDSSCETQLVKDTASGQLVVKRLYNGRDLSKYVEAEIINRSLLRHPHVLHFKGVFLEGANVCELVEYANGGSLSGMLHTQGRLPEGLARWLFQQLVLGLDYCHKRGCANHNMRLEKLLIHNEPNAPHPILKMDTISRSRADFRSNAKDHNRTLSHMAPEALKSCGAYYNAEAADVWGCGVVLYVMLYGSHPFDNQADEQGLSEAQKVRKMLWRMENEAYPLNSSIQPTVECVDLLRGLLKPNPDQRFTIEKIMDHPWFNKKLPPQAREMNAAYLACPLPEKYQKPDEILSILQQARARANP